MPSATEIPPSPVPPVPAPNSAMWIAGSSTGRSNVIVSCPSPQRDDVPQFAFEWTSSVARSFAETPAAYMASVPLQELSVLPSPPKMREPPASVAVAIVPSGSVNRPVFASTMVAAPVAASAGAAAATAPRASSNPSTKAPDRFLMAMWFQSRSLHPLVSGDGGLLQDSDPRG